MLLLDIPFDQTQVFHLEIASRETAFAVEPELEEGVIGVDALDHPVGVGLLASCEHADEEVGFQFLEHFLHSWPHFQFLVVVDVVLRGFFEVNQSLIQVKNENVLLESVVDSTARIN